MRIGLVYDLLTDYPWRDGEPADANAENEPVETVEVLEAALRSLGHEPVRIGTPAQLLHQLPHLDVDAAVNISEGAHSRNREGWAPTLLEMAGIPFLGSDALTLSVSLDKAWTKDLVTQADVPTPAYRCYAAATEIDASDLPGAFPLFVKPRYEGTAIGISRRSRVATLAELTAVVSHITTRYAQDAIVEPFVQGGGEYTVAVVGHDPPRALPVMQRATDAASGIGLHALGDPDAAYRLDGELSDDIETTLKDFALRVFHKLDCRDFARMDFRVDAEGKPWFLEVNPLPTFARDGTFAILAELEGRTYDDWLSNVLAEGFRRLVLSTTRAPYPMVAR